MDIKVLDDNPIYKNETYRLEFKFSQSYPIGRTHDHLKNRMVLTYGKLLTILHRSTRSRFPSRRYPQDTYPPSHLFKRYNMPRPTRQSSLEPCAQCRERVHQLAEHAHW
jgi:hypothetical protein